MRLADGGAGPHHRGVTSVTSDGCSGTMPNVMSEHTEQLNDLAERIAAAKEFL